MDGMGERREYEVRGIGSGEAFGLTIAIITGTKSGSCLPILFH
jgi:hypothetical protein